MSIYSGFSTRQQETFYNKLVERMIQLISFKLLFAIKKIDEGGISQKNILQHDSSETNWFLYLKKVFKTLHKLEKHKFLEPKFSNSVIPLVKFLASKHNGSGSHSIISQSQRGGGGQSSQQNFIFNDNLSMSSLMSTDTQRQITRKIDMALSKLNSHKTLQIGTSQAALINQQNGQFFSMQEKSLEEEEDKEEMVSQELASKCDNSSSHQQYADLKSLADQRQQHAGRNSGLSSIDNTNLSMKASINPQGTGLQQNVLLEPLLRNKYNTSNRTLTVNPQTKHLQMNTSSNSQQQQTLQFQNEGRETQTSIYQVLSAKKNARSHNFTTLRDMSTGRRKLNKQQNKLLDQAYKTAYQMKSISNTDFSSVQKKKKSKLNHHLQTPLIYNNSNQHNHSINNSQLTNYSQSNHFPLYQKNNFYYDTSSEAEDSLLNQSRENNYNYLQNSSTSQRVKGGEGVENQQMYDTYNGFRHIGSLSDKKDYFNRSTSSDKAGSAIGMTSSLINSSKLNYGGVGGGGYTNGTPKDNLRITNAPQQMAQQVNVKSKSAAKKINQDRASIIYNVTKFNMKFIPSAGIQRKYVKNLNELAKIQNEFKDQQNL